MEGNDLMQFESPTAQIKSSSTLSFGSPGSNPFDSFQKLSESFVSKHDKDVFNLSDFLASGKQSLGILPGLEEDRPSLFKHFEVGRPAFIDSEGNPSLGILKDFEEGRPPLFKDLEGKAALGILKDFEEGKPSLGILKDFEEGRPSLFKDLGEGNASLVFFKDFEEGKPSLGVLKDFEEGRPSLFKDLDEGKPSLGILKDFEEGRPSLFKDLEEAKASLAVFKDFDEGKPSLGILKDFEEGRPSLLFTEADLSGRESLGVLKIDALNASFIDNNVPEISNMRLNPIEEQLEPSVGLNTAFLCPENNLRNSILSNTASPTPSPSLFNSGSLEGSELSKIYSVNGTKTFDFSSLSALNNAFILSKIGASKRRILSLPEVNSEPNVELKRCLSEKNENADCNRDEAFNDSVFIEANHLAFKIADGSVLEDYSFEGNMLDSTSPPSFKEVEEIESEKCSTEVVFKTIDKMLPIQEPAIKSDNKDEPEPNHSTEQIKTESARSSSSSESRRSRDPTELLHDLSSILQESKDAKQKQQGQQLLNSLANILCNSTAFSNDNLEDSGHSSIETDEPNQEPACFEVLDLRKKNRSEAEEPVLDLSMKCKRLSQSFSIPSKPTPAMPLKSVRLKSASSLDSKDQTKLKPKKIEEKKASGRKGPLKAVIPLGNMSKCFSTTSNTPPKPENTQCGLLRLKRTSTPITESQLRPVAQSTPDGALNRSQTNSGSSQLQKRKFSCPISPLTRPNNTPGGSSKSGQSVSTPNLSNRSESSIPTPKTMLRRHSATELKQNENKFKLKRTSSIGKDFKTVQSKVKNASSSSRLSLREHSVNSQKESPKSAPLHTRNFSIKPLGLLGRFKKGKENKN